MKILCFLILITMISCKSTPKTSVISTKPAQTPSACVEDMLSHAQGLGLLDKDNKPFKIVPLRSDIDIDGDGELETEFSVEPLISMVSWPHIIYRSNKGCPQFVGTIHGAKKISILETKNEGLPDLGTNSSTGCSGNTRFFTRYTMKEGVYTRVENFKCDFCPNHASLPDPPDEKCRKAFPVASKEFQVFLKTSQP